MLFNSAAFALFFPVVLLLHFTMPKRHRVALLLVAGMVFYGAFVPAYLGVLWFLILVDYAAGRLLERTTGSAKTTILVLSIAANLGILGFFKYWNFFAESLNDAGAMSLPLHSWLLPIGLSFHTFQSLSYTIEVFRGRCKAERSLTVYALYVLYFPQLVAGPIERPNGLLPQLHALPEYSHTEGVLGLRQMVWGFFKKLVVADRLAVIVDAVYAEPTGQTGPALVIATLAFAFQIYADFSGYSDIALGASRVLGIRLMRNFDAPYLALSLHDFWRRWHISLSTWFRDYVYVPLGGSQVGPVRWALNIMVTFLLSGLWHGANWTFVVWGAWHGTFLIIERVLSATVSWTPPAAVRRVLTFALVCIAWIFFRSSSLEDSWYVLTHLTSGFPEIVASSEPVLALAASLRGLAVSRGGLLVTTLAVGVMLMVERQVGSRDLAATWGTYRSLPRWALYYAALASLLLFGRFAETAFIYFQF